MRTPETRKNRQLKEILIALDKNRWDAAGKGDWTVYEKLLDDDYFGFYLNSSGFARADKATGVAAVKRRRYFDAHIRDEVAKRIGTGTAILTFIYSCKVEEAGHVQTYRDHQATQVWTQRDGSWVLSFSRISSCPEENKSAVNYRMNCGRVFPLTDNSICKNQRPSALASLVLAIRTTIGVNRCGRDDRSSTAALIVE